MAYRIEVLRSAVKELEGFPRKDRERLAMAIDELANNPRDFGAIKLSAPLEGYRVRSGSYRIFFEIDDKKQVVTVREIARRTSTTY